MRFLSDLGLFALGLIAALFSVSIVRLAPAPWGMVQLPIIVLSLMVFFAPERHLAAFALGLGIGLDAMSAYPFFVWTAIVAAAALCGWWISRTVLTNRSLPSLILLGAAMRLAYFIFELAFSRAAELFGGSVWYLMSAIQVESVLAAFGIELATLAIVFIIYARLRGERSRMLTHV